MTITAADESTPDAGEAAPGDAGPGDAGHAEAAALRREVAGLRAELERMTARLAEAEGLADRDALTPLLNRRAFMRELARGQAYAERYGGPLSLVYFDLDGLKAINDRFGHAAGDATLKAVAERLETHVRASDAVGRIGGDEFVVMLAQTNGFQAEAKARSLAAAIADEPIAGLNPAIRARLSWGVAEVAPGLDPEAAVAQADAAMYAARRARRG
jgi:diguanylate cyclase (GGDEF)-like protein